MSGNDERARQFLGRIIGLSKAYGMSLVATTDASFAVIDYDEAATAAILSAVLDVQGHQHAPAPHVPLLAGGPDEELREIRL